MITIIAGIEIPDTAAADEATAIIRATTSGLIFDHSRRVFLFAMIHARRLGLTPDPELLYLSALFHDAGLMPPHGGTDQRFELDGADTARNFLLERGFSAAAADIVWMAIALHTTPGVPTRMGPEIAAMTYGVLTDMIGWEFDSIDPDQRDEIVAAHPRPDFKNGVLQTFLEGLKDRPDTTYGTVNADVLEHYLPDFHRTTMIDRITGSPWPE
jgi:hypothetical protein